VKKGKKKTKSHTQAQNKSRYKTEVFFYGPFLPIWYCINLSFWYLDLVCSAATGVLFVWIPRLLDEIPDIREATVSR
jgi:hypothetical protein